MFFSCYKISCCGNNCAIVVLVSGKSSWLENFGPAMKKLQAKFKLLFFRVYLIFDFVWYDSICFITCFDRVHGFRDEMKAFVQISPTFLDDQDRAEQKDAVTSRDRSKSAPHPRLKNSKRTSKCQFTVQ